MKFALIALVATVAAADASDYSTCLKGSDCAGKFICCGVTKTKAGSAPTTPEKICVPFDSATGVVPSTVTTPYSGASFFCKKADHTDVTNPPLVPKIGGNGGKAAGASALVVSATSAAAAAFLLA